MYTSDNSTYSLTQYENSVPSMLSYRALLYIYIIHIYILYIYIVFNYNVFVSTNMYLLRQLCICNCIYIDYFLSNCSSIYYKKKVCNCNCIYYTFFEYCAQHWIYSS